ncbi:RbcX protein [Synechococcus sp. PCC 7502]|uniref:RuBisCO chaperone RbcX n=1 Tax=Synechococcus sp. PCC 7502 TaxID=1173263 RepID=UPI00029FF0CA|nr:chaperonin family protein RbcX [Synechococcus sp. PCC 7502]AFY73724.1 RbcX protein [Synechococcus sp. PCC 7502]
MDLKQVAKDTTKVLSSYLTYQAVKVVISQLSETNPPLAIWLSNFSSTAKIQDGEAYIQELMGVEQPLAFRIMTVREHLAQEVTEFLPEMTIAAIAQANMKHRCQYLEKVTQFNLSTESSDPDAI